MSLESFSFYLQRSILHFYTSEPVQDTDCYFGTYLFRNIHFIVQQNLGLLLCSPTNLFKKEIQVSVSTLTTSHLNTGAETDLKTLCLSNAQEGMDCRQILADMLLETTPSWNVPNSLLRTLQT